MHSIDTQAFCEAESEDNCTERNMPEMLEFSIETTKRLLGQRDIYEGMGNSRYPERGYLLPFHEKIAAYAAYITGISQVFFFPEL